MRLHSIFATVVAVGVCLLLIGCPASNPEEHFKAGNEFQAEGRFEEAIAEYDETIRLDPAAGTYYNRGASYKNLGQYERAIQDQGQAIRLDPQYPNAYYRRAVAYTLLGNDEDARQDIDAAVALGVSRGGLENLIELLKEQR